MKKLHYYIEGSCTRTVVEVGHSATARAYARKRCSLDGFKMERMDKLAVRRWKSLGGSVDVLETK